MRSGMRRFGPVRSGSAQSTRPRAQEIVDPPRRMRSTFRSRHRAFQGCAGSHRNNDLGPCCVKGRQIAGIVMHVADDDRFPGFQRRPAQPLGDWETRICRWLVTRSSKNYEILFHDLVNADPAIIACRANHLCDLLHSLWRAPTGQRKCPDLL